MVMLSVQSEFPRQLGQGGELNCLYYWQSELHWDRIARPLIRWKQWFSFQRDYQDSTGGQNMVIFSARRRGMNITGVQLSTCPSHHWQIVVLTVWIPRTPLCFRMPQRLVLVTQGTLWALPAGFQAVTTSSRSPCATLQDARTVGQEWATLCTWKQSPFQQCPCPPLMLHLPFSDFTEEFCSNLLVHSSVNSWHLHWKHPTWGMCDWGTNEVISSAASSFTENMNQLKMA